MGGESDIAHVGVFDLFVLRVAIPWGAVGRMTV